MNQVTLKNNPREWLKVLGKGMITMPKKWRDELGIENGDIVMATKEGNKVVIEAKTTKLNAPYRVYTTEEITAFLEADPLPDEFARKVQKKLSKTPKHESIL